MPLLFSLIALLPVPRRNILIGVALFHLVEIAPQRPLIDFFNLHSPMPVGRVADSSDLLAWRCVLGDAADPADERHAGTLKRLASLAVAAVCLFSFPRPPWFAG